MSITTERVPELYSQAEDVPLEPGEEAQDIIIRTTADGGYIGNHFEVAPGTRLAVIGFNKLDVKTESDEIPWFHRAYVNSTHFRSYMDENGTDKNIFLSPI